MKKLIFITLLSFSTLVSFTGCAKAPTQDIDIAKLAIESVKAAEGEYYAKDELKRLQSDLTAALNEINTQDKKLLKKYDKAKGLLATIKSDSDALIPTITQRKSDFSALFRRTIAEVYVQGISSSMICAVLSDWWHMAIESSYLEVSPTIEKAKKAVEKVGLYKVVKDGKASIDEDMKKIKDPPQDYRKAYELLLDMYGYHIQLYNQALSPTGSYISFNQFVNSNYSEFEKAYEKILVVMPEVKEEVEAQKSKLKSVKL